MTVSPAQMIDALSASRDEWRVRAAAAELALTGERANHDCTVTDAQAAVDKLESELATLRAELEDAKTDLLNAQSREGQLRAEVERLQRIHAIDQERIAVALKELEAAKTDLLNTESYEGQLRAEVERLRAMLDKAIIDTAEDRACLAAATESLRELLEKVKRDRDVLHDKWAQQVTEHVAALDRAEAAESSLAAATELLNRCLPMDLAFQDVERDIVAFLANQPAAPTGKDREKTLLLAASTLLRRHSGADGDDTDEQIDAAFDALGDALDPYVREDLKLELARREAEK